MIYAFANPIFAWAGIFLAALVVYGLVRRLFKMAVFFAIFAGLAWIVFFAG